MAHDKRGRAMKKVGRYGSWSPGPARRQGPQGTDPEVRAKVVALVDKGWSKPAIAKELGMHEFQVAVARALGGRMKEGPMQTYFRAWAVKYGGP
jgi:hypothetical protein